MSFVKLNLVLKTNRQTDQQTNGPTDGPTNLSIEATCRRLKTVHITFKKEKKTHVLRF